MLALEKSWVDSYVGHLPEVRARDLVKGVGYQVVSHHAEGCRLYSGGKCSCRPDVHFYAEARDNPAVLQPRYSQKAPLLR